METHFQLNHYSSAVQFLSEIGSYLHQQEIYNSIFINQLEFEAENDAAAQCYFSALMDPTTDTLIFALMALKDSFLYASGVPTTQYDYKSIVEHCVRDFLTTSSFPFRSIHSYEPVLDIVKSTILEYYPDKELEFIDDCWGVHTDKIQWSERAQAIREDTCLKLATMDELPLIMTWFKTYLRDISEDETYAMHAKVEPLCREKIEQQWVYILYNKENNTPLSMAWKTRPLLHGCSIAHVYTPEEHRHVGYAAACVSMLTEHFLEKYKYVSLFVAGDRDPTNNMYSRIGYKLFGRAARFTLKPKNKKQELHF